MSKLHFLIFNLIFLVSSYAFSQTTHKTVALITELDSVSKKFNVQFNYDYTLLSDIKIHSLKAKKTLSEVIKQLNTLPQLKFTKISAQIIIVEHKKSTKNNNQKHNIQHLSPVFLSSYLTKGIDKKTGGAITINYSKFNILPGLIETDVLLSTQALPGIQSINETVSNISIRGGSNDQNLILWDDIKMYQSGHFFGLISSFNPNSTQKVSIYKNGTDASYSDGVSGMLKMQTKNTINTKLKTSLALDFLSGNVYADIPTGKNSSLQIASRKSLNSILTTPTYTNYFNRITQNTEAENNTNTNKLFNFYDASLRWLHKASSKHTFRLNFITTQNNLVFNETALLNNIIQKRESSLSQQSYAGGIFYKRKWNTYFTTEVTIYETDYLLKAINANILEQQQLLQKNSVSETSIRLQNTYKRHQKNWINGYQIIETKITNLNDIDIPRFKELKADVVRTHSLFSQLEHTSKNNALQLKTGIRLNYLDKFNTFIFEPRLMLNYTFSNRFKIEALSEFKHQNSSQIINFQNDFLGIEKRRWQLTNNSSIPITKSEQHSLGATYNNTNWLVDIDGYHKTITGITTQSQEFSTKYEFEKTTGKYNALGIDALLKKRWGQFNNWISYSFMNSNYTFKNLPEITFPNNFNITHTFTLGTAFTTDKLKLSVGFNFRTGKPTSRPIPNQNTSNTIIAFESANTSRLANYFRADASAIYTIKNTTRWKSNLGISVWNLTNNQNIINHYFRKNNENATQEFSQYALGTTINLMLKVYFTP